MQLITLLSLLVMMPLVSLSLMVPCHFYLREIMELIPCSSMCQSLWCHLGPWFHCYCDAELLCSIGATLGQVLDDIYVKKGDVS